MLHVQFDRRLGKRKIGREKFAFLGLGHLTGEKIQQPQQNFEVDIRRQHDAFDLKEVAGVRRIDMVVPKAARDGKVLARHRGRRGQGSGGYRRPLASKHQSPSPFAIVGVPPAGRARRPAVLVGRGHSAQERFGDGRPMRRLLHEVHVVNIAGRVKLRHEERVHVPELGLHERTAHLLKAHADQFPLHQVQKLPIGMPPAHRNTRRAEADRIFAKAGAAPGPVFQQLGAELRQVPRRTFLCERRRDRLAAVREAIVPSDMVVDPEGLVRVPALNGITFNDRANRLGQAGHLPGRAMQVFQSAPNRLGGGTGHAGRFDEAAGYHPERSFLFQAPDGGADLRRFESLLRLELSDGEAFPRLVGGADGGQDALNRRVFLKVSLAHLGQGGNRRDRFRLDVKQPLSQQPFHSHTYL